ncbi:MAG: glutamyl-tRNA reductase [Actinobacteria bacterium]|uniref:glutamyl-tRNA reductase n=1 Tax=freshwater metagenome TaxID=449393 RepID=A0A6J7EH90_9ZZZZ|nr:glutamyl-tRNA reductase [Actinomycetota bacterium]
MVLVLVGASHHDVTLDEISRLSQSGRSLAKRLTATSDDVSGAVVLSTCNRFEVYLDLTRFHEAVEVTTATIAELAGLDHDFVVDAMRVSVGTTVAQHLFSVASGLESMVVGEDEIAGQVKASLALAQEQHTTSPTLERLLQRALATSKAVTSSTGLGAAGRSIVSVGLDLVGQRHGDVSGRRALVLGTGSYARVVVAALARRGCTDIDVYSSSGRSAQFAQSHGATAVDPSGLAEALARADLVAACSGSSGFVLTEQLVRDSRAASTSVLPVIDLALSPDVSPEAKALPVVDVIDLEVIHEFAPREHSSAILGAQDLVLGAVQAFEQTESGRTADHAVIAMRAHVMAIINEEVDRIRHRVDEETAEEVARSLNRVSNAILHMPSVRAQELARTGDFADYSKAVHTLFGIEIDSSIRG